MISNNYFKHSRIMPGDAGTTKGRHSLRHGHFDCFALGYSGTRLKRRRGMSALPPKADMCIELGHVSFGPEADIAENSPSGVPTSPMPAPRRSFSLARDTHLTSAKSKVGSTRHLLDRVAALPSGRRASAC